MATCFRETSRNHLRKQLPRMTIKAVVSGLRGIVLRERGRSWCKRLITTAMSARIAEDWYSVRRAWLKNHL